MKRDQVNQGHGGRRPGAGRPKGRLNKRTEAKAREIAGSGITPLDYLVTIYRDEREETKLRIEAARAAAPYVHSKMPIAIELETPPAGAISIVIKGPI